VGGGGDEKQRKDNNSERKEKDREINIRAIWFLILKQTALLNNILFVCLFVFLVLRLAFCGHMSTVVGGTPTPSFKPNHLSYHEWKKERENEAIWINM
jgi:hypothetical protein